MTALWIVLGLIVLFLAVILIRAAMFKPAPVPEKTYEEIPVDGEKAVSNLQQLVQCATVSYEDAALEEPAEFEKLFALLPKLFPHVMQTCEQIPLRERALLFRWKGESAERASVLMAHFDVVPVVEELWEKPPFAGIIENDVLWGRGTLDTKATFSGILTAADALIEKGFVPKEDIYLAFSGSEEINGPGAPEIVKYFEEKGISLSMVVDEGGAVVEDVFPGVSGSCALIGIAEKGMLNLRYDLTSNGGHASAPAPHTPVGELAAAVTKIENKPIKMHINAPAAKMFDTLGRYSSFVYKLIFSNLWCFGWVLDLLTKKSGGELNALLRTTVAFTQMNGSKAPNVIPPAASVVSNIRINPGETVESVIGELKSRIGNDRITLTPMGSAKFDPSPVSRTDVDGWERVSDAVRGTWQGAIVSPYLMVQCSDSRHYRDISDRVYRFSAMHMTKEERGMIHGNNERITFSAIEKAVEFFTRLILAS